jgi:hypothetical protein
MPLVHGRRTPDTTALTRDGALVAKRVALGGAFVAAALGVGVGVGGVAWALAAVVSLPGLYTLASARRPFTAPCPGCGSTLGDAVVHLPDEPVLARGATDVRCAACGIYVDGVAGGVREVPFNRTLDAPGYELAVPESALPELRWGERCVACGEAATRGLQLRKGGGIVSGEGATFTDARPPGTVPYCAAHGGGVTPSERALVVAKSGAAVTLQLSLYASYRRLLDDNRERVDVSVRAMTEPT